MSNISDQLIVIEILEFQSEVTVLNMKIYDKTPQTYQQDHRRSQRNLLPRKEFRWPHLL